MIELTFGAHNFFLNNPRKMFSELKFKREKKKNFKNVLKKICLTVVFFLLVVRKGDGCSALDVFFFF